MSDECFNVKAHSLPAEFICEVILFLGTYTMTDSNKNHLASKPCNGGAVCLLRTYFYNTECPIRYCTRHFFNNSNTKEDIATKFEQECVVFFHISYAMR
jgi:hypothetical protein